MSAKCIEIYFSINRNNLNLPPLVIPGYVIRVGRKTRAFNHYGQPVNLKINKALFACGKTTVDSVEVGLRR